VIDFVTPYFDEAGISVVMKKTVRDGNLFKFTGVLSCGLWLGIGAVVLATALLLWTFETFLAPNSNFEKRSDEEFREVF
jgi:hypothetical protein